MRVFFNFFNWQPNFFEEVIGGWEGEPLTCEPQYEDWELES